MSRIVNTADSCSEISLRDLSRKEFKSKFIDHVKRMSYDSGSYWYLLKNRRFREFSNFFYTKFFVPTGEGSFLTRHSRHIKYPDQVKIPKYIEMETTTVCNKKCVICEYVYWPKEEQVKRHLKLDEFKHIINQFPEIRWANLTGEGSSFLNKDYTKMLKYLWERDKTSIWLVDHLNDISIETLEKEVFPYIQGIYLSMDAATKKTYESIKRGCDFDKVINNLRKIIDYKKRKKTPFPHLSFRYIIIKDNVHEIFEFAKLIAGIAGQREWGGSATMIEFTGLLYFKDIIKYYVEKIPITVVNDIAQNKFNMKIAFSHAEEELNPPIEKCAAWLEPYIMLPGYVLPCCSVMMSNRRPFLREYAFGNVLEDDFKNIWNNEYYMKFRSKVNDPDQPVPKICVGCRAFQTKDRIKRNGIWDVRKEN